jgi:hypothetical protein
VHATKDSISRAGRAWGGVHDKLGTDSSHALKEREALLVEGALVIPTSLGEDNPTGGGLLINPSDTDLGAVVDIEGGDAVHALELTVLVVSQADRSLSNLRKRRNKVE